MLRRKIMSASITGAVFPIVLAMLQPDPLFGFNTELAYSYFHLVVNVIPVYFLFSFPVILVYGVMTSMLSDKAGALLSKKTEHEALGVLVSLSLHLVFGLVLLLYSLGASLLFFMVDRVLMKRKKAVTWKLAISSLLVPIAVFLIVLSIIRLMSFDSTI